MEFHGRLSRRPCVLGSAFNVHERSARTSVTRPPRVANSEVTTARVTRNPLCPTAFVVLVPFSLPLSLLNLEKTKLSLLMKK